MGPNTLKNCTLIVKMLKKFSLPVQINTPPDLEDSDTL